MTDRAEAETGSVDLTGARWRKSSRSGTGENQSTCVEVAFVGEHIAVRDSKDPQGAKLLFTRGEWDAFLGGARDGEFDRP